MALPALFGGLANKHEIVPSIFFAAAHGLLVPIITYRAIFDKNARTALLSSAMALLIERSILFSLRACVAINGGESKGLTEYMQTMFAMGTMYLMQEIGRLMRCILVHSTYTSPAANPSLASRDRAQVPVIERPATFASPSTSVNWSEKDLQAPGMERYSELPDQPILRSWFRMMEIFILILLIPGLVTSILGNSGLVSRPEDPHKVAQNQALRLAGLALQIVMMAVLVIVTVCARVKLPRVERRPLRHLGGLFCLLGLPTLYRLAILNYRTTDWHSSEPGAQNSQAAKAAFYILLVAPEYLACAYFCFFNIRQVFKTGPGGDKFWRDETEEEKQKREQKEREMREKREKRKQQKSSRRCTMGPAKP